MHNVKVEAIKDTIEKGRTDPGALRQPVNLSGEWQVEEGQPQFRGVITYPKGEVEFDCDFPPPLGGNGTAPNPLAYCFWGGLACYALTFATEAALRGIELKALRGRVTTEVDQTRTLGLSDRPPVEKITWELEVDPATPADAIQQIKAEADARCPGVYCIRNPINLETRLLA